MRKLRATGTTGPANQGVTVTVSDGWWGDWLDIKSCQTARSDGVMVGQKMTGFSLRQEASCGSCDDTALNGLRMICSAASAGGSSTSTLTIAEGIWGDWAGATTSCASGAHIIGARLRLEAQQGKGDDTAANSIEFMCSNYKTISQGAGSWGDWGAWVYCPTDSYVCGAQARFESGQQGSGDDTAFNGLRLQCCTPMPVNQGVIVTVSDGWWGDWLDIKMCQAVKSGGFLLGKKMTGFSLRREAPCGSCDDTALNGLRMICSAASGGSSTSTLSIAEGIWGDWAGRTASCASGAHIIGARLQLEASQGSGDDTAANSIEFMCSDKKVISQGAGSWGDWGAWVYCPTGNYVCGAQARFESGQGNGDDTAFNGQPQPPSLDISPLPLAAVSSDGSLPAGYM
ncbi:Vitelline membrane outer layer protein 1 [Pleodorina starrii]|nr:Vitelline membrane outer layer protein 1 [Pleodorina starrii]